MNRRDLLRVLGAAAAAGLAGCNDSSSTATHSPTPTGTPSDEQAPTIISYDATPQRDGTALAVSMEGEDDRDLAESRIVYGERELTRQPDGTTVTIDGTLEDTATTSPEDGRVAYVLTDAAGNETRKQAQPDESAPELTVTTQPTTQAGQVALQIEAEDDTGLADVAILVGGEATRTDDAIGSREYADDPTVTVPQEQRFQRTPAGARARDWNGNTTEKEIDTYVRKYDRKLEDTRLNVGTIYISHQGDAFEQQCRDSYEGIEPAVGIYDEDPIPTEVTSQHVDQMTGHGINRVLFNYSDGRYERGSGRISEFLDSPLLDQIEIEPFYGSISMSRRMDASWRDTVLPRDLTHIRDTFLERDTVATIDDRPVVSTWNFSYFHNDDDARSKLLDEFGSYETFVDEMRSHLRVDGTDPFLIVGKGPQPVVDGSPISQFVRHFDGMTTWFPPGPWSRGEADSWDDIIDRVQDYFANNHRYATDHDMEFTPRVFPGYDDRGSGCGRTGYKHIPRSTGRFRQLLDLAEQYATSDRIDVATWNDWTEGHQIEPGTFNGDDYGTDYLEIVEQFQRGDTE